MNKMLLAPQKGCVLHALTAFFASIGCVWPLCGALGLTAPLTLSACVCAAAIFLLLLCDCVPRLRLLGYPLLLAAAGALIYFYSDRLPAVSGALTLFLNGQPLALAAYSRPVVLLLSLLFSGFSFSLTRSEYAFFPLAVLAAVILLAASLLGTGVSAIRLLPLGAALLLSSRVHGAGALRVIPCAALIFALLFPLLPVAGQKNDQLSSFAARLQQAIDDYLFFTDARTTFSLSATGWQPLGPDRLGGPVAPTNTPVMQVYTSGRTLLRGTVKNTYTGSAFIDTTDQRRYLFVNPRFSALRRDLFDQMRPEESIRDSVIVTEPMIVSMRTDGASTLFITQRFTSPAGEEIVAYFAPSTELFATRSLASGARYTFTGSRLTGASENVRRAVLQSSAQSDAYYDTIAAHYLDLPDTLDDQVLLLAQQITMQADNDFDRAAALCSYLQRTFPYTLMQNTPPAGQDFVSWFLLDEQQGYCTSFASALAVMGRAVGLPTRYVEGYAAQPDSDGIARVTQENAHAWVEIYFKGFGWLPFDPTPGSGFVPDGHDGHSSSPQRDPDGDEPPEDGDSSADRTPTPTPEQTPSPSPTSTPVPTPSPSPTPEHGDPSITPTPEITPAPTPAPTDPPPPTPTPKPPQDEQDQPPLWPALLLILLLLLMAAIVWRLYSNSPAVAAAKLHRTNDQLLLWYAACCQALLCLGIAPEPGEGPASYMERAQAALGGNPLLTGLGRALCISRYSAHKLSRVQVEKAEKTYLALLKRMKPLQRLRMYMRRVMKGVKLS